MKIYSPLRAVRAFCLDCCCDSSKEVELCPAETCPLWLFRFGSYPADHQGTKSVLRPIKARCKDCLPEEPVRDCEKKLCSLWPYRLGTNPKRKGLGGTPPLISRFKGNLRGTNAVSEANSPDRI
jgi:hypothetical protein